MSECECVCVCVCVCVCNALHILLELIEGLGRAHGPAVLAAEEGTRDRPKK
jgi:hypothetical protein